jgi:hypothetical protein
MKCQEFSQRLQQTLDDRSDLGSDWQLQQHAQQCPQCREQWQAWQQIASVMQPAVDTVSSSDRPRRTWRPVATVAALAAAVLLAVLWQYSAASPELPAGGGDPVGVTLLPGQADPVDPADWWRHVQRRDWMAQTMPAVRSVRDGVAPLGRSLLQAVTLLTTGGHRTT